MKVKTILVLLFLTRYIFADVKGDAWLELFLDTYNVSGTESYIFELSEAGTIWDENFQITSVDTVLNSSLILYGSTFGSILKNGWDFISSQNPDNRLIDQYGGVFGYGIYKLSLSSESDHYIYICYFDCQYPDNCTGDKIWGQDISIVYDDSIYKWQYTEEDVYHWLAYGDTVTMDQCLSPICFDCFQPTTPADLTVSWSNNRPLLTWSCSEPRDAATYEVWRKVMGGFKYSQTIEDWCCIAYKPVGDTTYSDNGFASGSGYKAYYKIRAVSGDDNLYSPGWSNTVSVTGSFTPNSRSQQFKVVEIDPFPTEFCLHPVYPNPFNISTTIKLDLPEETRFSLVIYDLSGAEIWCLNDSRGNTLPPGYHVLSWDGRNNSGAVVPTGVYLVVYTSPEHRLTQKVILMK